MLIGLASVAPVLDLLRLHVRTNFFALLPDEHPSVVNLQRIIDEMGGFGNLMVVVESPKPEANRRFVEQLHDAVTSLSWVNYADHGVDPEFLEDNALLYVSLEDLEVIETRLRDRYEYEVSQANPMFVDLLDEGPPPIDLADIEERYRSGRLFRPLHADEDGTTAVLAVYPRGISGDIRRSRRYLDELSEIIGETRPREFHPEMSIPIGGSFKNRVEEYDLIMRDLVVSGLLMSVVFIALLLLYFRQIAAVPVVFLTFGLPLLWTFALTRIEFETDFQNLQSRLPPASRTLKEDIRTIFAGRREPVVVLAENLEATARIESVLAERIESDVESPTIDAVSDAAFPSFRTRRIINALLYGVVRALP